MAAIASGHVSTEFQVNRNGDLRFTWISKRSKEWSDRRHFNVSRTSFTMYQSSRRLPSSTSTT